MNSLRLRLLAEIYQRENLDLPTNKAAITGTTAKSPRQAARHWALLNQMKEEGLVWTSPFPNRLKDLAHFHLTPSGEMTLRLLRSSTYGSYRHAED